MIKFNKINKRGKVIFMKKIFALTTLLIAFFAIPALAETQSLFIEGDHGKLAAVLQNPDSNSKCPIVIICHGFMGKKDSPLLENLANDLEAAGIASIRFDFNGHGESEGRFQDMTVPNEIEDAKKVFNFVKDMNRFSSISIAGHSQGGVVSSMVAGELGTDNIKAVALFAPAAVLRDDAIRGNVFGVQFNALNPPEYVEIMGHKVGRNYFLLARDLPIYETAKKYQGPACLIHGTGDIIVPYTYSSRYHEIWENSEIRIIPEWDHGFRGHEAETAKIGAEFFIKHLK